MRDLRHDQYQPFGGTTNPRVALIYSPLRRTTLKLIYGQAFRAPNNYELYYGDHVSIEPNPHLQPEKIRTEELVWEQDLGADFRLSASGLWQSIRRSHHPGNRSQDRFHRLQQLRERAQPGFRGRVRGKVPSGIEGRLSYTLQKTVDPVYRPLACRIRPPNWQRQTSSSPWLTAGWRLVSNCNTPIPEQTLAGSQVASYVVSDLTLTSREFAKGFRVSGSVYNVFNSPYSDPVGAEIVGSAVRQNGRDFRIQLTHTFHLQ